MLEIEWLRNKFNELAQSQRGTPMLLEWQQNTAALYRKLNSPHEFSTDFLRWPTIVKTMWVGDSDRARAKLAKLTEDRNARYEIPEQLFGGPETITIEGRDICPNLINQMYALARIEHLVTRADEIGSVVELGGGYGALAYLFYHLGFRGTYTIYDLPAMTALQEYYLANVIGETYTDHYRFEPIVTDNIFPLSKQDLFVSCHAISEAPTHLRNTFTRRVYPNKFYITYNQHFSGIDNVAFFNNETYLKDEYQWMISPAPIDPRSWEYFGWKKSP